jgi:hypothetical protein
MKKVIFVLFVLFATKGIKAQSNTGVPDTLAYLNTIVANKANFVGQPFSVLANSLLISIKYFSPDARFHHRKNAETSTYLAFYNSTNAEDYYRTYPMLVVKWREPYHDINLSYAIRKADSLHGWNATAKAHYANYIIDDISVFK